VDDVTDFIAFSTTTRRPQSYTGEGRSAPESRVDPNGDILAFDPGNTVKCRLRGRTA
jgi:hypothetical protein